MLYANLLLCSLAELSIQALDQSELSRRFLVAAQPLESQTQLIVSI